MFLKWLRETPKGIFLIAVPWALLSACALWIFTVDYTRERGRSFEPNSGLVGVSWEWNGLITFLGYVLAVTAWVVVIAGPVVLAVGLLRRRRKAIDAARYLSLFWVLLLIVSFGLSLADPYGRTDFEDWFFLALVVAYNLWSWWYLSRTRVLDKVQKEEVFLNLDSN